MDFVKFIEIIRQELIDEPKENILDENTEFRKLDSWDSLTGMAIYSILTDEMGSNITEDEFQEISTFGELFRRIQQ